MIILVLYEHDGRMLNRVSYDANCFPGQPYSASDFTKLYTFLDTCWTSQQPGFTNHFHIRVITVGMQCGSRIWRGGFIAIGRLQLAVRWVIILLDGTTKSSVRRSMTWNTSLMLLAWQNANIQIARIRNLGCSKTMNKTMMNLLPGNHS
jgi:hypothetical protein